MNNNLEKETLSERDKALIRSHANREIQFALELMAEDDVERYGDIGEVLRRVAHRYDALREGTA